LSEITYLSKSVSLSFFLVIYTLGKKFCTYSRDSSKFN